MWGNRRSDYFADLDDVWRFRWVRQQWRVEWCKNSMKFVQCVFYNDCFVNDHVILVIPRTMCSIQMQIKWWFQVQNSLEYNHQSFITSQIAKTQGSTMMTSSNGNIFRVSGLLWGESTDHRMIPLTKASDAELWYFLWSAHKQTMKQTIESRVIWDAIVLISLHCNDLYLPSI